ncbi:hypothetical protein [Winogradskyella sp. MH6]|uniref:hypothetical protein n=1 Tax=Winogradskyella sp. MH6 TaxID=2929510 RepID=UPI001FB25602|nr:hypothetical protein [Winogradskyella sp. MH6]
MKQLLFIFIIVSLNVYGQKARKVGYNVKVVEEYTVENYKLPDSILFFSGGKGEIEYNYRLFFKKLKKKMNKIVKYVDSEFDDNIDFSQSIKSFEDIDYDSLNFKQRYVCVFSLGDVERNKSKLNIEEGKSRSMLTWNYSFYMMLLDTDNDKVLIKRKFKVTSSELIYKNNSSLLKAIKNELNPE